MTGIELIAKERQEQIEKHGFDEAHDRKRDHTSGQLIGAAGYLLASTRTTKKQVCGWYPDGWNTFFRFKFNEKDDINKLVTAGALIAAEIDRRLALTAMLKKK